MAEAPGGPDIASAMPEPVLEAGAGIPGAPKPPSRLRVVVSVVVGVGLTVAAFAVLIPQLGSYEQAMVKLGQMPGIWIITLGLVGALNLALYPSTVMVSIDHLRYGPAFVERQTGFLVSNCIPGGGVFAVGAQYRILAHYGVSPAMSAAAVTSDAVWTYLITLGLPSIAVTALAMQGDNTGKKAAALVVLAIVGVIAVVASVLMIRFVLKSDNGARRVGRGLMRLISRPCRRLHREVPDLEVAVVAFRVRAHDLIKKKWRLLTLTNVATQLMPFLVVLVALGGLGAFPHDVALVEVFAAYAVAQLLVSIPITPGGLGTVDAALVALLTAFGVPGPAAVATDLLWRLVWFLPQMLAGVAALLGSVAGRRRAATAGK